jgi:O-antigen/teichoic acid export membrane protein
MTADLIRLAKTSGIYLVGNVVNRIGAFLLLPLYTHRLSLQQYGLLELLYSTISMVSVLLSVGLSHATLRFYFEFQKEKDRNAVITTNFSIMFILSVVTTLVLLIWKELLAELILDDAGKASYLTICFAIIILELTAEILLAYLRAREFAFLFVALACIKLVVQVSGSLFFLVYMGEGVPGVLKANLVSVGVTWLVAFIVVIKNCGFSFHKSKVLPILRYSLPFALGAIVAVARGNVDRFMLKELVSMEAVGIYGLAAKFSSLLSFLLAEPFSRSYGAFRFSMIDNTDAAVLQSQVTHYLVIGATFLSLGISLFTPDIINTMTTRDYINAAYLVPVLLIGSGFGLVTYCFQTGILYSKKTKHLLHISLGAMLFSIVTNFFFIKYLGIWGAAISCSLIQVFIAVWTNLKSQNLFRVQYPTGQMFRIVTLGVCAYIPSVFIYTDIILVNVLIKVLLIVFFVMIVYFFDDSVRVLFKKARMQLSSYRIIEG